MPTSPAFILDRPASLEAFRLVLIISSCRERPHDVSPDPDLDTPAYRAGVYAALADKTISSPLVWQRCRLLLDGSLRDVLEAYRELAPIEVVERFCEKRNEACPRELAAMVWSLIRRSRRSLQPLIERLGRELQVVIAERAVRSTAPPTPVYDAESANLLRVRG